LVVKRYVVTDNCRFTDDGGAAMVNEHSAAELCARMDFYAGQRAPEHRDRLS